MSVRPQQRTSRQQGATAAVALQDHLDTWRSRPGCRRDQHLRGEQRARAGVRQPPGTRDARHDRWRPARRVRAPIPRDHRFGDVGGGRDPARCRAGGCGHAGRERAGRGQRLDRRGGQHDRQGSPSRPASPRSAVRVRAEPPAEVTGDAGDQQSVLSRHLGEVRELTARPAAVKTSEAGRRRASRWPLSRVARSDTASVPSPSTPPSGTAPT